MTRNLRTTARARRALNRWVWGNAGSSWEKTTPFLHYGSICVARWPKMEGQEFVRTITCKHITRLADAVVPGWDKGEP